MNLVTVFWLLFAASALVSGLALLQSLRILLYRESSRSNAKSGQASYQGPKNESDRSSNGSRISRLKPIGTSARITEAGRGP